MRSPAQMEMTPSPRFSRRAKLRTILLTMTGGSLLEGWCSPTTTAATTVRIGLSTYDNGWA